MSDSPGVNSLWICSLLGATLILSPDATPAAAAAAEPPADFKHSDDDTDPYCPESLPENDEETTCFLCRTNRLGPCRSFWRPLEHCVKDQTSGDHNGGDTSSDSDRTSICDRYVRPFEECWTRHAALYLLISHAVTKDMQVDRIERNHETRIVDRFVPAIDWTGYREFCRRPEERQESERVNGAAQIAPGSQGNPLWHRFDQQQLEPSVVTLTSQIPIQYKYEEGKSKKRSHRKSGTHSQSAELTLRVAYALDQEGNVMGYTEYNDKDDTKSPEYKNEQASKKLLISLLPGHTESFQIKVLYADGQRKILISTRYIVPTSEGKKYNDIHKLR